MSNYIYIATSLDGYIATKNGGIEWLNNIPNPDKSDFGFNDFMELIDGIVMGRNTFETVLGFEGQWPYSKKVFVLSDKLKKVPIDLSDKVEIIYGEVDIINSDLKKRGFMNLYIDGGKTIQEFLKAGLIDEMIITRVPIILGGGIPLFSDLDNPIAFKEVKSEVINNFLVKSHYKQAYIEN